MRRTVFTLALILGACGSDQPAPTPSPAPAPVNVAPAFTSGSAVSIVEDTAATAYQATASDANGDAITFSITGGADAARFSMSAQGALSFSSPPNFDRPEDANRDNVHQVQIRASDGTLSSTLDLPLTVTNSTEGIRVRIVSNLVREPFFIAPHPSDNTRFF